MRYFTQQLNEHAFIDSPASSKAKDTKSKIQKTPTNDRSIRSRFGMSLLAQRRAYNIHNTRETFCHRFIQLVDITLRCNIANQLVQNITFG